MDYDALERLVKLRDSGAITEEEFTSRKALLLDEASSQVGEHTPDVIPGKLKAFLARAEDVYLGVLRAATLVLATVLIAYGAWLGLSGMYNASRNAASVKEEPVTVSAEDVAKADVEAPHPPATDLKPASATSFDNERKFYQSMLNEYYALFQRAFEKYRKDDDKSLTKEEFDKRFLNTGTRIDALKSSEFDFNQDKTDLTDLVKVMTEVGDLPETRERLVKYKGAERKKVEEKVNRTRDERFCSYYGYYIQECITYDTRQVSYVETKVSMKLPAGVVSYADLFDAYQRRYLDTLRTRRDTSRQTAETERREILAANARGKESLWTAITVAGAFLVLMFFFLLVAIERHQRKLAAD